MPGDAATKAQALARAMQLRAKHIDSKPKLAVALNKVLDQHSGRIAGAIVADLAAGFGAIALDDSTIADTLQAAMQPYIDKALADDTLDSAGLAQRLDLIARSETQRLVADLARQTAETQGGTVRRETTSDDPCDCCIELEGDYDPPYPDELWETSHPQCQCGWVSLGDEGQKAMVGETAGLVRTPFLFGFGFKASREGDHEGEHGLILEGYAVLFGRTDQQGETPQPGMLANLDQEWGAKSDRKIYFHHGWDPVLRKRVIGKALDYKVDDQGMWVKVFIPETVADGWAPAAKARFKQVYQGIKNGAIRGFSVAGMFLKRGKALMRLIMDDLSVTPAPVEARATYVVGQKAVKAMMTTGMSPNDYAEEPSAAVQGSEKPPLREQSDLGVLTRENWTKAMQLAHEDGARHLHDHLLEQVPVHLQGEHKAESCPICMDRRMTLGVKALQWGGKAITKSEEDGDHPASHYLYVGDPDHPTTWKIRVRDVSGAVDRGLLGPAHAALTVGWRGQDADIPEADKAKCLAKLKKLYTAEDMDWPEDKEEAGQKARIIAQAEAVAAQYEAKITAIVAGAKAGRRLSAASKQTLQHHVDTLEALKQDLIDFLNEEEQEPANDDDGADDGEPAGQ